MGSVQGCIRLRKGGGFFPCFVFEVKAVSAGQRRLESAVWSAKGAFTLLGAEHPEWMGFTALSDVPSPLRRSQWEGSTYACDFHPWTASLAGLWRLSFIITVSDCKRQSSTPDVATEDWCGQGTSCRVGRLFKVGKLFQRKKKRLGGREGKTPKTYSNSYMLAWSEICIENKSDIIKCA